MTDKRLVRDRQCATCSAPITIKAKTGLCNPCANRRIAGNPEVQRRKSEGLKRYAAENVEAQRRAGRIGAAKRLADPVKAAQEAERMRNHVQPLSCTPEQLARGYRTRCAQLSAETKIAWCPEEYRDHYRQLINGGFRKAEAKPMILEMIRLKAQRERARLSPFERQEADLAAKLARGEEAVVSNDMFRRRAA